MIYFSHPKSSDGCFYYNIKTLLQTLEARGVMQILKITETNLLNSGLNKTEIVKYLKLQTDGITTLNQRILLLQEIREKKLDEIHLWEKQIQNLDYLRHELKKYSQIDNGGHGK